MCLTVDWCCCLLLADYMFDGVVIGCVCWFSLLLRCVELVFWYFFCGFDLCLVINSVGFSFLLLLLYAFGCVIVDLCS